MTDDFVYVQRSSLGFLPADRMTGPGLKPAGTPGGLMPKASSDVSTSAAAVEQKGAMNVQIKDEKLGLSSLALTSKSASAKSALPPRLQVTSAASKVLRFRVTTAVSKGTTGAITVGMVLGSLGNICTVANTTVVSWASSVRVKSVTMWLPTGLALGELAWASGVIGQVPDEDFVEDIPSGITVTQALHFRPPAKSLSGSWINSSAATAVLFGVTAPVGTIIDLSVDYRLSNVQATVSSTVASGALGSVYYLALNGPATNTIQAVGLPTTA